MLYFFDVETGSRFNQLSGHLGPVRDVCWAYDESLLASCDTEVRVQQTARGLVGGVGSPWAGGQVGRVDSPWAGASCVCIELGPEQSTPRTVRYVRAYLLQGTVIIWKRAKSSISGKP